MFGERPTAPAATGGVLRYASGVYTLRPWRAPSLEGGVGRFQFDETTSYNPHRCVGFMGFPRRSGSPRVLGSAQDDTLVGDGRDHVSALSCEP